AVLVSLGCRGEARDSPQNEGRERGSVRDSGDAPQSESSEDGSVSDSGDAPQTRSEQAPERGSIRGLVSADGAPASKVRVCARRGGPQHRLIREDVEPLICSETDASGSYELGLAPGVWWVFAWQRELLPDGDTVALRASKPHATFDLSLRRGGRAYAGKLVDLDGKPIHGARVEALSRFGERLRISASVSTDAQ